MVHEQRHIVCGHARVVPRKEVENQRAGPAAPRIGRRRLLNENRNIMWTKRGKARLIVDFQHEYKL